MVALVPEVLIDRVHVVAVPEASEFRCYGLM